MFTLAIIAIILISSTIAIQVQQPNPVKDYLIPLVVDIDGQF